MIKCLIGKTGSGKTHQVYQEIGQVIESIKHQHEFKNQTVYLVVPEQYTLQGERDLIEQLELPGLLSVEVLSFKRIMYRVFSELGFPPHVDVNDIGKSMILKKIMKDHQDSLLVYNQSHQKQGFIALMAETLRELKYGMVSEEQLEVVTKGLEDHKMLQSKLEDIQLVYGEYTKFIEKGFYDEEDKFHYLLEKIMEKNFLNDSLIYIDGFDNYTKMEYQLINCLAKKAKQLTVTVTSEGDQSDENEAFIHTNKIIHQIKQNAYDEGIAFKEIFCQRPLENKVLRHMEANIFSIKPKSYQEAINEIKIFEGSNRYLEVEHMACEIYKRVIEDKLSWKDIAIVTNDLDTYGKLIKRVLDDYEMPYFYDDKTDISDNPLSKLIINTFNVIQYNYKKEHVLAYMKTGLFDFTLDDMGYFENYCNERGIKWGKFKKDFEPYKNEVEGKYDYTKLNEMRVTLLESVFILEGKIKDKQKKNTLTPKTISSLLYDFLCDLNIYEKMQRKVDKFAEKNDKDNMQKFAQMWQSILDIMDQFAQTLGDEPISLKDYQEIFLLSLGELKIGIIPEESNRILIGNLERSKSHRIKDLYIVGVNDGILPKKGSDHELIIEIEKSIMNEKGFEIFSSLDHFIDRENFSIYSAFCRPHERLWLSYALSDFEGKGLRPSQLIEKVTKLYPQLEIMTVDDLDEHDVSQLIGNKETTYKHLIENIRKWVDGRPIDEAWFNVLLWYKKNDPNNYNDLIKRLKHKNYVDKIDDKYLSRMYDHSFKTSVTGIEMFNDCPFKYFVSYGLKPKLNRDFEVEFFDMGLLFHKVLELFSKSTEVEKWQTITEDECYEKIDSIIDEMIQDYEGGVFESTYTNQYLKKKLKRVSKKSIWQMILQVKKGDFIPKEFEMSFKGEGHRIPIHVSLPSGEIVKVTGVIDRIDTYEKDGKTFIRIVDYKSGFKEFSLSDVYNGFQMQLIVYLLACLNNANHFDEHEVLPAGIFYYKIDDPIIETSLKDKSKIEQMVSDRLKLDGLVLENMEIVEAMDKEIENQLVSDVVPVKLKKDLSFSSLSKVASHEDFMRLIQKVKDNISDASMRIIEGEIHPFPAKSKDKVACQYCQYKGICQFDTSFDHNEVRKIKQYKSREVLELLESEEVNDATMDRTSTEGN